MKYTVEELAKSVEGKVVGDGSVEITETRGLDQAARSNFICHRRIL